MEMRQVLAQTLEEQMGLNDRIVIVDADLSKADGTYPLRKKYAERMFNVGVQEANMASFAAGLSSYGFIPFITTFTAFASRRIFDQVTISIVYARRNVKIIGTDPGVAAEYNGGTHMSMEDAGLMRALPGMVVFEPCDNEQLRQALPQIIAHEGPVYIRMFRKVTPDIFGKDYRFDLFTADVLRRGKDVSIFASGVEVKPALDAAEMLFSQGVDAEVINVHTLKPLDSKAVIDSVCKTGCAVTCENHNIINGLGSAVTEVVCECCPVPVLRVGAQDRFGEVGKMDYLMKALGLTAEDIVEKAQAAVALKQ